MSSSGVSKNEMKSSRSKADEEAFSRMLTDMAMNDDVKSASASAIQEEIVETLHEMDPLNSTTSKEDDDVIVVMNMAVKLQGLTKEEYHRLGQAEKRSLLRKAMNESNQFGINENNEDIDTGHDEDIDQDNEDIGHKNQDIGQDNEDINRGNTNKTEGSARSTTSSIYVDVALNRSSAVSNISPIRTLSAGSNQHQKSENSTSFDQRSSDIPLKRVPATAKLSDLDGEEENKNAGSNDYSAHDKSNDEEGAEKEESKDENENDYSVQDQSTKEEGAEKEESNEGDDNENEGDDKEGDDNENEGDDDGEGGSEEEDDGDDDDVGDEAGKSAKSSGAQTISGTSVTSDPKKAAEIVGSLIGMENTFKRDLPYDKSKVIAFPPLWIAPGAKVNRQHEPELNWKDRMQDWETEKPERQTMYHHIVRDNVAKMRNKCFGCTDHGVRTTCLGYVHKVPEKDPYPFYDNVPSLDEYPTFGKGLVPRRKAQELQEEKAKQRYQPFGYKDIFLKNQFSLSKQVPYYYKKQKPPKNNGNKLPPLGRQIAKNLQDQNKHKHSAQGGKTRIDDLAKPHNYNMCKTYFPKEYLTAFQDPKDQACFKEVAMFLPKEETDKVNKTEDMWPKSNREKKKKRASAA